MYDVVALDELMIDFASVSKNADSYPTMAAHLGGAPAIFLAAISKFGGKTAIIGKVGTDSFGHLLINTLKNNGIDGNADKEFAELTGDKTGIKMRCYTDQPGVQIYTGNYLKNIVGKGRNHLSRQRSYML